MPATSPPKKQGKNIRHNGPELDVELEAHLDKAQEFFVLQKKEAGSKPGKTNNMDGGKAAGMAETRRSDGAMPKGPGQGARVCQAGKDLTVQDKKDEYRWDRRKLVVERPIENWLKAYCTLGSVFMDKFPGSTAALFLHEQPKQWQEQGLVGRTLVNHTATTVGSGPKGIRRSLVQEHGGDLPGNARYEVCPSEHDVEQALHREGK
ncbi:hypothetical protein NDU88_005101 [Pleurodeles waltl]|uniref:Uncharacterized protein n=1 Tax=Pleurodeles waltl TaxID=8319 RepID=A0AAV7VI20_PLEWA|nr:hypothetical protein NDU88_005101 [Pleurodeles waltl]